MPFIQPAQLERALPEWKQTKKKYYKTTLQRPDTTS